MAGEGAYGGHKPLHPHGRSPAPALRRGERWGRSAPCGGALGRFPALQFSARLTAFLCAAALRARRRWRNAWTRRRVQPAVLVVGSLGERRAVRGSARCRGRRRGAKKSLFAPDARWLLFKDLTLLLGTANTASLNLRCYCWNVWPVCGGATACGRRPRYFASGGCEGTLLQNAFSLLSIHFLYPRTCLVAVVAGAGLGAALPAGRGTAAALPPHGALAPCPQVMPHDRKSRHLIFLRHQFSLPHSAIHSAAIRDPPHDR